MDMPVGGDLLPLGLLAVAGIVHFMVFVYSVLTGFDLAWMRHWHLSGVLAPLLCLLALLWAALRLLGRVPPETGTGFALAALGIAARALAHLTVWFGPPPGRALLPDDCPRGLVSLVLHTGTIACVTGVAFVAASSARSVLRPDEERVRVPATAGMWVAAAACLVVFVLAIWGWTPAVLRLRSM